MITLSTRRVVFPVVLVSLVLVVGAPATAQEPEPDLPILELTTTHHSLAWRLAESLAAEEDFGSLDFPDLEEGQQLRLVFGSDEKVRVSAVPAGERILDFRVRRQPELLGKIAKEQLGVASRLLHMTAFMTLTANMQMEGRHAARVIKSAMEFHHQLEDLHLTVNKTKDSANGYGIDLWVTPKQGTWLSEVVDGIEASKAGAPHLRSPNASLTVTAAAEGKGLGRLLEPFANHLGLIRGHDKAERSQFMTLARGRLEHFDGCFGLIIDGPGRYVRMLGLTKPQDYTRQAAQKAVQTFDCRRAGRTDVVIAEAKDMPAALTGSGMQVLLKETDPFELTEEEDEKAPKTKVGLTTFAGVVEDFSIKARLPEQGKEMARLVDRVRQKQLRRMPLLEGGPAAGSGQPGTRPAGTPPQQGVRGGNQAARGDARRTLAQDSRDHRRGPLQTTRQAPRTGTHAVVDCPECLNVRTWRVSVR